MNLRTELKIRTPEGVVFSYRTAGPVVRMLAWVVDLVIIALGTAGLGFAGIFLGFVNPDLATALVIIAYFGLSFGYGILCEWLWNGQTLGKRLLRLRVIDTTGLRLVFHQLFLRNLLRAVDGLPLFYLVGGLTALFSRHAQRLGDMAAGTVVVSVPIHAEPNLEQLLSGKYNSLRRSPHLAARLRQRVSPEEAQLALRALLRRELYFPEARLELFRELAERFKAHVAFPEEDVESLPDEQYVRNVVDLLFRGKPEPAVSSHL